jgi:hypothetical protein
MKRLRVLLVLATALVSAFAAVTVLASEQSDAAPCTTKCPPPPEEEPPQETPPPQPKPTPSMLMINVGWITGSEKTSAPLQEGALKGYVDYLGGHFKEWLAKQAPGGYPTWTVTSGGAYEIAPPPLLADSNRCSDSDKTITFKDIADAAEAKARERGINPDLYSVVVIGWSKSFCDFGGIRRGRRLGITYRNTIKHEFGHYLGLREEAYALVCKSASGTPASLSGNCYRREYGDYYDSMGGISAYAYNAIHANRLEWLKGQFVDLTAGSYSQTLTLKPYTDPVHGQRAIRLRDGATTLWMEYRSPVGVDSQEFIGGPVSYLNEPGLIVHRETDAEGAPRSELLDMTPGDEAEFRDAGLPIGKTWANPLGTMSITLNSVTAADITVTISDGRVAVPDVRGLDVAKAEAVLSGAGLKPAGRTSIVDPTCAYIGVVASTSPSGGARVPRGTSVTLAIGEQDPFRSCQ